jgi:hypothetical protein
MLYDYDPYNPPPKPGDPEYDADFMKVFHITADLKIGYIVCNKCGARNLEGWGRQIKLEHSSHCPDKGKRSHSTGVSLRTQRAPRLLR